MKYLRKFENNPHKRYLVVDFSKLSRSEGANFYVLRLTDKSTEYSLVYDGYYYYELGDLLKIDELEDSTVNALKYDNYSNVLDIVHETDSKEEALNILKMLVDINKFNL